MGLNLKGDVNAEVAAAPAPASPEEIRVFRLVTVKKLSIGGDNLRLNQVIAGKPELAAVETVRLIWLNYTPAQVGNAVREIVEELYKFPLKESVIKEIVKGERSAHGTNLALSIEAWAIGVSYSPLHKFYYSSETVAERRKYFEQKDDSRIRRVEASKLEIKRLPRKPLNIMHDYESAINLYDHAYQFYKIGHSIFFPFLCNDEDRIKYLERVPGKHILHELPD